MTYAKLCEHGALARQCEICELKAEVAAAEKRAARLAGALKAMLNQRRNAPEGLPCKVCGGDLTSTRIGSIHTPRCCYGLAAAALAEEPAAKEPSE